MNKAAFTGIYAGHLNQFVDLKNSLGYKYTRATVCLYDFDRFTIDRNEQTLGISKELAQAFCAKRSYETNSTTVLRTSSLRTFASYLCDIGIKSFIPTLCPRRDTHVPHVFSHTEIEKIFSVCDALVAERKVNHLMIIVLPTLFRLLYATGLRIGEALDLKNEDVNLDEQYLVVKDSKNGKQRMIPVSDSLASVCREYVRYRDMIPVQQFPPYFFITLNGMRCRYDGVRWWFMKILKKAGIPYFGRRKGPHIHHFRHTFSTHSLAMVAESGKDLYSLLPHLSAFLGHDTLESTNRYIRLTAEIYPQLVTSFDTDVTCKFYPKIEYYNESE